MAGAKSLVVLCILLVIATSQAAPCKSSLCYGLCRIYGGSKTFCAKRCNCSLLSTFVSNELKTDDYNCAEAVLEEMTMMEVDNNRAEAVLEEMTVKELISMNGKLAAKPKFKYNPCYRACRAFGGSKAFCARKCKCLLVTVAPAEGTNLKDVADEASTTTE